jgi:hypothetical protein
MEQINTMFYLNNTWYAMNASYLYSSKDGLQWQEVILHKQSNYLSDCCYNTQGTIVISGDRSTGDVQIYASNDGKNFQCTFEVATSSTYYFSLRSFNNAFILYNDHIIYYSTDGFNWSQIYESSQNSIISLAICDNTIVVLNSNNELYISTDAHNWYPLECEMYDT